MKRAAVSTTLVLLLICAAGIPATTAAMVSERSIAVAMPVPEVAMEVSADMDFSKLQISPRHSHTELMPGESDKVTVTVTNRDNKTISVAPKAISRPHSEYIFDEDWVTITPKTAELKPDAREEFIIEVTIPGDAECGYYGVQIVFTDDVVPTPYPTPYPNYINAFDLSINVWKEPVIQIQTQYIHDRIESDREYDYQIKLKNIGDEDIAIDPEMGSGSRHFHGPFGGISSAFDDDAIAINAPDVVEAGETAVVDLHLSVPVGAKGGYQGELDLNIDDPSIDEWDGIVHLNFDVWNQPTEPYVRRFAAATADPVTIEITSNPYPYKYFMGMETKHDEDPSFDVKLAGPDGVVDPVLTTITYTGSVSLGTNSYMFPPWEADSSEGMYHETGTSYTETYTVPGATGNWTLEILPHDVDGFGYTIWIGDKK